MKIFKKLLQILRICDILFLAVKKTLTALVAKNILKLTDRVGFLTNHFLKKAEKPSISVKLRYFVLEPKISGGFNNGVKKSVSYRPARNS